MLEGEYHLPKLSGEGEAVDMYFYLSFLGSYLRNQRYLIDHEFDLKARSNKAPTGYNEE
jgi:hypothetical protein